VKHVSAHTRFGPRQLCTIPRNFFRSLPSLALSLRLCLSLPLSVCLSLSLSLSSAALREIRINHAVKAASRRRKRGKERDKDRRKRKRGWRGSALLDRSESTCEFAYVLAEFHSRPVLWRQLCDSVSAMYIGRANEPSGEKLFLFADETWIDQRWSRPRGCRCRCRPRADSKRRGRL